MKRWLLDRAHRKHHHGAQFLTGRQLARERAMALPVHLRRGAATLGYMPDGVVVLPSGGRVAIELELTDKADRLADKLTWYRDAAGYDEVLWLVPGASVEGPLWAAIEATGCAGLMAVEPLPAECLAYSG